MHTKQHFKQMFGFSETEGALENTNTVSEFQMSFHSFIVHVHVRACSLLWAPVGSL